MPKDSKRKCTSDQRRRVRPAIALTDPEMARLVLDTEMCFTTVHRWADGRTVSRATNARLERAMAKRGIPRRVRAKRRTADLAA